MKKCPLCAEEIQDEALKCKHCGGDLTKPPEGATSLVRILGMLIMLAGIGAAVWAMQMDTSVATAYGRVHNLSLAEQRQTYLMGGGIGAVIGLLLTVFGGKMRKRDWLLNPDRKVKSLP